MDAPDIVAAKRRLRGEMRARRTAIPAAERLARSMRIWSEVLGLVSDASADAGRSTGGSALRVLAFAAIGSEPPTDELLVLLSAAGHETYLPRVEGDGIVAVPYVVGDETRSGAFGTREPVGAAADPVCLDVIIVPGLAFTTDGRRLGQGGGFYDRFLPLVRPECITCGVGFHEQIVDDLPTGRFDRLLDHVVTDAGSGQASSGSGGSS